jgi:hypothetical protein
MNPTRYENSADNQELIPAPALRIDTDIPKKVVTV